MPRHATLHALSSAAATVFAVAVARAQPMDHAAMHAHAPPSSPFFGDLLRVYTPRRACMFYEPQVIWLHVASDALIALAYFSIPFALVHFVRRRRDVAFGAFFWMFAAFILACGATHAVGVLDVWAPYYRLDGVVKAATAALSLSTAVALWRIMPRLLTIPSATQLEETVRARTAELARASDERRVLLEQQREALAESERAGHLKDEFLATLSHELRTPLTAILGWAQLLRRQHEGDGKLGEALAVIERNARVQSRLVDDLLDMSRIVSGTMRVEAQTVSLAEVIRAALDSLEPAATAKGIRVERRLDEGVGMVRGDFARLQQVMWNLLSNAIKFTPRGGAVTVSLAAVGDHVAARVADTGAGIDPEFLPHVFERFRQQDGSTTRRHGGLGLGLAIVKNLVELHGGTVRAESAGGGRGAAFVVELPRAVDGREARRETPWRTSPLAARDAESLDGVSVLVVDDETDSRQLIAEVLRERRATVYQAATASDAMEVLRAKRPTVIVSDVGMPGEDGYEFIRKVRALDEAQGGRTPAAALTAFVRSEDRMRAMRAGYQVHVGKPVEPAELITVVASLAGKIVP